MECGFSMQSQKLRKKKGISRRTLSELCGLNKDMILLYENGTCTPKLDALIRLSEFFQISLDELCRPEN